MTIHVFRKLKDTNGIIRSRKSNEKLHNSKKRKEKWTKYQNIIYKILQRKPMTVQHENH